MRSLRGRCGGQCEEGDYRVSGGIPALQIGITRPRSVPASKAGREPRPVHTNGLTPSTNCVSGSVDDHWLPAASTGGLALDTGNVLHDHPRASGPDARRTLASPGGVWPDETVLHGSAGERTEPTPCLWFRRCGRTSGVQAQACGSGHERRWRPRSRDADPFASAAHLRSLV